jgi:apolipoprotein N-acyltransferase
LTNEAFAGTPGSHELLFAMNVFRAAENGVPLVRAATTTISAIVAADGSVLERSSTSPGIIVADLPPATAPTLYARLGDWTLLALAGLSVAVLFAHPQPNRSSRPVSWRHGDSGRAESLQ